MKELALYYARMTVCGILAFAAVACVRLGPPEGYLAKQEPHAGEPSRAITPASASASERDRVDALERQVADLDADLVHLRKALEIMGPLPQGGASYVPVVATIAPSKVTMDEYGAGIPASDIYATAPALPKGQSLFYEAELGAYASLADARAGWEKLASEIRLTGLEPHYDSSTFPVRLSVGPLTSKAAVDALCVELATLAGPCRAAAPVRAYR
jgi:SPOR domain